MTKHTKHWLGKVLEIKDGTVLLEQLQSKTQIVAERIGPMVLNEVVAIYHDFEDLNTPAYEFQTKAIKYLGEVLHD